MDNELQRKLYDHALRFRNAVAQEYSEGKEAEECDYPSLICPHCGSYDIKIISLSGRECKKCGNTDFTLDIEEIIKEAKKSG